MKIQYIKHKDKTVLAVNYFECENHQEIVDLLKALAQEFKKSPTPLLTLEDYTDAHVSNEFMNEAKSLGKELFITKRAKGAILGITGVKKVLLNSYNSYTGETLMPFDTKEEALEYLAS